MFLVQETTSGKTFALKRLIIPDKERMKHAQDEVEIMVCLP